MQLLKRYTLPLRPLAEIGYTRSQAPWIADLVLVVSGCCHEHMRVWVEQASNGLYYKGLIVLSVCERLLRAKLGGIACLFHMYSP